MIPEEVLNILTIEKLNRMKYIIYNSENFKQQGVLPNSQTYWYISYELVLNQCIQMQENELLYIFEFLKSPNPENELQWILIIDQFAKKVGELEQNLLQKFFPNQIIEQKNIMEINCDKDDEENSHHMQQAIDHYQNQFYQLLDQGKHICDSSQKTYTQNQRQNLMIYLNLFQLYEKISSYIKKLISSIQKTQASADKLEEEKQYTKTRISEQEEEIMKLSQQIHILNNENYNLVIESAGKDQLINQIKRNNQNVQLQEMQYQFTQNLQKIAELEKELGTRQAQVQQLREENKSLQQKNDCFIRQFQNELMEESKSAAEERRPD